MNRPFSFPFRPAVHRCAVCNRPLACRMRICPYCGEDVPVRYPLGLSRFAPASACTVLLAVGCVALLSDGKHSGELLSYATNRLHSPASVILSCAGLILLFLPPAIAEPGVPLYTPRQRALREALWRLLYLLVSVSSAAVTALSAGASLWWGLALSLLSSAILVFSVAFHVLPPWIYPVSPLFLAAAFV